MVGKGANSFQGSDMTQVQHMLRLEQLLAHRGNQVRAPRENADRRILAHKVDRLVDIPRSQKFELRKTQSSPPASAASRREGSSGCRSGPLPRNQSEPPCSRKRAGDVGSMPSVISIFF